jgi:predicted RNase H-like HicB family nuclease
MRRYAIVVEDAGPNLSAYVPDLPGCVSTADDSKRLKRRIQEAISMHIEGLQKDGLPIPEPTSKVEYVEIE